MAAANWLTLSCAKRSWAVGASCQVSAATYGISVQAAPASTREALLRRGTGRGGMLCREALVCISVSSIELTLARSR